MIQRRVEVSQTYGNLDADQLRVARNMEARVPGIIENCYGMGALDLVLPTEELSVSEESALANLTEAGYALADQRYGTGWPNYAWEEVRESGVGVRSLGYNNGRHARDFAADSITLNNAVHGTRAQRAVDLVIAAWHDVVQTSVVRNEPRLGQDEQESAEQLVRRMREEGIAPELATIAVYGIMGTWPVVDAQGRVAKQWGALAPDEYYPSAEARRAAQHASSNDLAHLYTAGGPFSALMLYAQRQGKGPFEIPDLEDAAKFYEAQLSFLSDYRYPLPIANRIFTVLKPAIIDFNEKALRKIEDGGIDAVVDWRTLCLRALRFARNHGQKMPAALLAHYSV